MTPFHAGRRLAACAPGLAPVEAAAPPPRHGRPSGRGPCPPARVPRHPAGPLDGLMGVGTDDLVAETDADVYRRLAPELTRFATALVGRVDAPDVLSSAVVKALAAPGWGAVANRRAYLYRAVVNEAQTWLRRAGERPRREARAAGPDRWDLPAFHDDVRRAVAALSVRQRAVVVLTYWGDLPTADVADRLGISDGSVRRHLARARAHLREALDA